MKTTKFVRYLSVLIGLLSVTSNANSVSLILDNDTLSFPKKDSEFTNGTELKYMIEDQLWIFDNFGFSIQQNMYGPKLDKTDNMKEGEHPYCGYLAFNFIGEQWFETSFSDISLNHQFGLGGVGKHTYAEQTQKYIHKILGCKDPKGWKKWQIRDEFIAQYQLYVNFNTLVYEKNNFTTYIIPRVGVDVGGFKDMIAAGVDLKIGLNTPKNSGSSIILSAPMRKDPWNLWLLTGVEGRCVFYDTSIDGGIFKDSPYTLDSETWVGEFHWGIGTKIYNFEIEYRQVIRTKEFATNYRRPNYGQLIVGCNF